MNAENSIDLTAVITTPENIQFEYRIAGPFRRLPAFLLDFMLRCLSVCVFFFVLILVGSMASLPIGMMFFLIFLVSFAFDWFYGLFFETYWNGQTPGKWLTRLRVISVDGRPINAYQATVRNFLRLADFAPMISLEVFSPDSPPVYAIPTFLVSLLCMAISPRFQRLGDLAAGTMVVVNQRSWVPAKIHLEDARVGSLSELIPPNFRMTSTLAKAIALYAERRNRLSVGRRTELASLLATPLLKQFGLLHDTSPDLLLCALYYREFVAKDAFSDVKPIAPHSEDATTAPISMPIPSVALPPILKAPQ